MKQRQWRLSIDTAKAKSILRKIEEDNYKSHDCYTDADKDRPEVICDSNGQVVLGLCKLCGRGEAELFDAMCEGTRKAN